MVNITREDIIEFCLIDPFNGRQDLEKGIIRAVGIPKHRFKEDSLRILRAIRFASRFGFEIEETTYKKMGRMSVKLLEISKERWMMEMDKILMTDHVRNGLENLWKCNCFKYMIPELSLQFDYEQNSQYHDYTLDEHTMNVVEDCPKDLNLRWAALLHDIGKPFVRTNKTVNDVFKSNYVDHEVLGADMILKLSRHLKWSKDRTNTVVDLVKNHLKEDSPLRKYDNMRKLK